MDQKQLKKKWDEFDELAAEESSIDPCKLWAEYLKENVVFPR